VRPAARSTTSICCTASRSISRPTRTNRTPSPRQPQTLARDGFGEGSAIRRLIAERAGKPVGFALYTFNYSVWTAARGIFIEDIWVVPEERRGGVRARWMVALAKECRARGYKRIDLNVLDWNPARGFYERIGFRWIRNWLPYRLSGEALETLAGPPHKS
jgi:GNAT superfamily N-acetyltransferase